MYIIRLRHLTIDSPNCENWFLRRLEPNGSPLMNGLRMRGGAETGAVFAEIGAVFAFCCILAALDRDNQ